MVAEIMPPAFSVVNPDGQSPIVLTCEHAANFIPASYRRLGLPEAELRRHIAWDVGMAAIGRQLAERLDAPLFLSGYSRLLIDCNRPIGVPSSIPEISESTPIPGNLGITDDERQRRAEQFFWPYQNAIAHHLDVRHRQARPSVLLSLHSFTPVFKGVARTMHAGILFRRSARLGAFLVDQLAAPGLVVAANQPYQITDAGDYVVPVHGEARRLDVALIEIRQDLVADDAGIGRWADRLETAFRAVLAGDFLSIPGLIEPR